MNSDKQTIEQLAEYLKRAEKLFFFTGAGISTDSGIPDFRGPNGVWKRRQPVYYQDFMAHEASRIEYWEYKLEWWEQNRDAKPNPIHYAIADLETHGKVLSLVTQNIDGLHQIAGASPEKLIELHGTNRAVECQSCGARSKPGKHFDFLKKTGKAPVCNCGGYLKPATISFGQNLISDDMDKAFAAAIEADCVIALGSTLSVYPAASFPLEAAKKGTTYIIINQGATDHDGLKEVSLRIDGPIGDIFPQAVDLALNDL